MTSGHSGLAGVWATPPGGVVERGVDAHMHQEPHDRPTVPSLPLRDDDDFARARDFGGASPWPVASGGARRPSPSARDVLPLVLGASLGLNVALCVGLVAVLVLARAGAFGPTGSSGASSAPAGSSTTSATLSTPAPTTSLSSGGWLQVAPSSVQVGCGDNQQTQYVVLTNTGPQDVQWQAVFMGPADQAGVEVGPTHGDLHAGASVVLQIRNQNPSATQQGVIHFEPNASAAGAGTSPSLSYTAQSCN